jgi:hypothetical protein
MLRLVQGDVGSGKTAVAAWALAATALAGRQGALLAPTDLLARQHAVTIGDLLADLGIPVVLLTGSLSAEGRRNAYQAIASGRHRSSWARMRSSWTRSPSRISRSPSWTSSTGSAWSSGGPWRPRRPSSRTCC